MSEGYAGMTLSMMLHTLSGLYASLVVSTRTSPRAEEKLELDRAIEDSRVLMAKVAKVIDNPEALRRIDPQQVITLNERVANMKAEITAAPPKDVRSAMRYLGTLQSMLSSIS
jgi:hypothetical protein